MDKQLDDFQPCFLRQGMKGLDCMARESQWVEAIMEVLDGSGDETQGVTSNPYMNVQKFMAIAGKSAATLDNLAAAPLHVEFSHHNQGLRRFRITSIDSHGDQVIISLGQAKAACKPMRDVLSGKIASCC